MHYVHVSFMNRDQWGDIKGVVRPAHNHGIQIQTLRKLNANAQYTIVAMSPMTIQYSVYDDLLATFFAVICRYDRTAMLRVFNLPYNRSYSRAPGLYADDEK